jgi:hypothetical protein
MPHRPNPLPRGRHLDALLRRPLRQVDDVLRPRVQSTHRCDHRIAWLLGMSSMPSERPSSSAYHHVRARDSLLHHSTGRHLGCLSVGLGLAWPVNRSVSIGDGLTTKLLDHGGLRFYGADFHTVAATSSRSQRARMRFSGAPWVPISPRFHVPHRHDHRLGARSSGWKVDRDAS